MTALSEYMRQLLEQGYQEDSIISFLKSRGYDRATIDASLHQAKKNEKKARHHSEQSNLYGQVYSYIYTMLHQGYGPQQINQTLLSQGYDARVVLDVFRHINRDYYSGKLNLEGLKRKTKTPPVTLMIVLLLIGVLLVGGVYFLSTFKNDESFTLSSVNINIQEQKLSSGEHVIIDVLVDSENTLENEPIDIQLSVNDAQGRFVTESTHTLFFSVEPRQELRVALPSNIPAGKYSLDATITHESSIFSDSTHFTIEELESGVEHELGESTTSPIPAEQDSQLSSTTPQSTIDYYSRSDNILFERALEAKTKETAVAQCSQMSISRATQECLSAIAREYDDETVCELADSQENKEECYIDLVLGGKQELCNELELPENKQFCRELQLLTGYSEDSGQVALD
ncbi:MAG: hypothetical protein ACQESE_01365 [Nanobdellota archaeon]